MTTMKILTEADLRRIVPLDLEAIACVEDAFHALATKAVAMPPILRLDIPEHRGEVDVKTAYVPGLDGFAIKISPGFFDNPKIGLPSTNGLMVLLSTTTGLVQAVLFDNGYLTDVRTAAAGAVAAKHLSREDASVAAIFGAGMQAKLQLEALSLVRPIREARIWARDLTKAGNAADELAETLGFPVRAAADGRAAVDGADIIVTATGFHLSVMGEIPFSVDGEPVDWSKTVTYHGIMFTGVPNLAYIFGYWRSSWTLRVDLICDLVCRLLDRMDELGAAMVTPTLRNGESDMPLRPWTDPEDFSPGYLLRSVDRVPRQGDRMPWRGTDVGYDEEAEILPAADFDDGTLIFK